VEVRVLFGALGKPVLIGLFAFLGPDAGVRRRSANTRGVGEYPDELDAARNRDLDGRGHHVWVRRGLLALGVLPVALALFGAFGQEASTSTVAGPAARVKLVAPRTLRGGLLWQAHVEVNALRDVAHPRIVLGSGFAHGMQVNSIEPAAEGEAGRDDGRIVLSYADLPAGGRLVVYLQFQVNPTTVGDQDTSVELDDAEQPVARVSHTITVLP
jgi:hypothetical protein